MVKQELRKDIGEINESAIVFDNPSFDNSIVGMSDDDRVVYLMESMIKEFMEDNGVDYEEAVEFISYNTLRALPYWDERNRPIVMDTYIVGVYDGE